MKRSIAGPTLTVTTKELFLLATLICLQLHQNAFAQHTTPPASGAAPAASPSQSLHPVSENPAGLSLSETEAWIKRELPAMGSDNVVVSDGRTRTRTKYEIESAVVSDCVLTVRLAQQMSDGSDPSLPAGTRMVHIITATLKDVDVGKVHPIEADLPAGSTASKPGYFVSLPVIPGRGDPFTSEWQGGLSKPKKTMHSIAVRLSDLDSANSVASTIRRAAVLCGAPDRPLEALFTEKVASTQTSASKSSKMRNADITELVTAGLSVEVIITSIRQAPTKDFDLTPTGLIALKKAHVVDEIISAMQNNNAVVEAAPTSEARAHPKYDPSLAEPPKANPPRAAPTSQDSCAGVEMMGLYQNEIFDRAMGGGVVEWLAKVRNNTSVTKIVVIGWRDVYGEQKTAQLQIRGGEIASPRLDLTQARMIAPVTEVRVVSCQ